MLSLSGVTAAKAQNYYGKDDYYFSDQKEAEVILGKDRAGEKISEEAFKELVAGRLEYAEKNGKTARIADDLTFSAPKSVSLTAALDDNMREKIIQAHREAVNAVVEYIESSGMIQARNSEGYVVKAWGAVASRFDHFLSRNMDPQLHSHVLIANSVFFKEREKTEYGLVEKTKEGAAYLREIYTNKKALGALYRHELASRLENLGYEIEWKKDGTFELKGFTEEQIKAFSTRREEILKVLQEKGLEGGKAAEIAAKDTRKAKPEQIDKEALRKLWEEKAKELGIELPKPDVQKIREKLAAEGVVLTEDKKIEAQEVVRKNLDTAGFTMDVRNELGLATALAKAGYTSSIDEIKGLASEATSTIARERGGLERLSADLIGRMRYTVHDNLSAELKTLLNGIRENQYGLKLKKAEKTLKEFNDRLEKEKGFRIEGKQAEAIIKIATGKTDAFVLGKAGAGKTTMMQAIREIYEAQGKIVLGTAPSGLAADNLQKEAGIRSTTVDSMAFLSDKKLQKEFGSPEKLKGGLLVVDEAGMMDSKRVAAIMEFANKYEMKIAWVGDPGHGTHIGPGIAPGIHLRFRFLFRLGRILEGKDNLSAFFEH